MIAIGCVEISGVLSVWKLADNHSLILPRSGVTEWAKYLEESWSCVNVSQKWRFIHDPTYFFPGLRSIFTVEYVMKNAQKYKQSK